MMDGLNDYLQLTIAAVIIISLLPTFLGLGAAGGNLDLDFNVGERMTIDSTEDEVPSGASVQATRESALYFEDGAYVESDVGDAFEGSWTVCLSAQLDEDANPDANYHAIAKDNGSILLQYGGGEWIAYYEDEGSDAMATVDAEDAVGEFVPVCGKYDESSDELVVAADGNESAPETLDNETEVRSVAHDWFGTLDEVRIFDDALESATIEQYASDQIQPLPETNQTARMMFDEGEGETSEVHYADEAAIINGASWTDGLENPSLEEGSDYELHEEPFSITVVEGGYLDGAPTVYVSWDPLLSFNVISVMGLLFVLLILVAFANRITDRM